jgi:hypothetical protein
MRSTRRFVLAGAVCAAALVPAQAASGHWVHVDTPSGQSNCQFLGGPGNPGHPGHTHGHPVAIAHHGDNAAVTFAGPCG